MSSKDTDVYMRKIRDRASKTGSVMDKITSDRLAELDKLRIDSEMAEIKARVAESQARVRSVGQGVSSNQAQNWMSTLFMGRSPEDVQKILDGLTPEKIQKLTMITSAMNPDQTGVLMQLLNRPDTSKKEIYNLFELMLKLNPPQQQRINLKDIAALMKEMRETAKPQQASQFDPVNFIKEVYATMAQKDEKFHELQLAMTKQPPLADQIAHAKGIAEAMGFGKDGRNPEMDLKLEGMRQSHDLDMERIDWEKRKYLLQQEAERDKWTAITSTLTPILQMNAPAIQQAVRSVAKDVTKNITSNPNPSQPSNPNPAQSTPPPALFTCPKCQSELTVPIPPNAPEVIPVKCPKCGEVSPAKLGTTEQSKPQSQPQPPKEEQPPTRRGLRPTYT